MPCPPVGAMLPVMDNRTARDTRPGQDRTSGQDRTATVAEVAAALGVTPSAVRKRLARGKLDGYKDNDTWRVYIDVAGQQDRTGATSRPAPPGQDTGQDRTSYAVSPSAMSQLEAIRDAWLQPLVDQIATLSRELGHAEEQRDAATAALDAERQRRQSDNRQADGLVELLEARVRDLEDERRR